MTSPLGHACTRRRCLAWLAGGSAALLSGCLPESAPAPTIRGAFADSGALAEDPRCLPQDSSFEPDSGPAYDVVVVGGGVSGLCAAWKLRQAGVQRVLVLESEGQLGGASVAGGETGMRFPWGAHAIRVPPAEADCVHEVLLDLGIISGYDAAGRPLIDPAHQLRWPHARLFMNGRWHPGIDPFAGAPAWEREEMAAFRDDMLRWSLHRGPDGRQAFALPVAYSTDHERVRALDELSMEAYLARQGWSSPRLHWRVEHACRVAYGASAAAVSAWAGIHWWTCRHYDPRFTDAYPTDVLTWPQGNAFLADGLARCLAPEEWRLRCLVVRIEPADTGCRVCYRDLGQGRERRVDARAVVFAAPMHVASSVVTVLDSRQRRKLAALPHSAWMVAAVHLTHMPHDADVPMAWDNVIYDGPAVGYVRADHQSRRGSGAATLSYYRPVPGDPLHARTALMERSYAQWAQAVLTDLRRVHPDVDHLLERVDVYRWRYGMVRPEPGGLWGSGARLRSRGLAGVSFATCGVSGLPLFEEAVYGGLRAAEEALEHLDVPYRSSLRGHSRG